ncbi:hypothetical protein EYF80_016988 [Liparis tanakae]|uniref:Uncharacterized protein n=1 Tax=Liparis tanakae TaxID=230148 RepID=A0A4Z2I5W2_9TELE|nr:hypothetical protein EYF80_016988 [Liparis tanakae]
MKRLEPYSAWKDQRGPAAEVLRPMVQMVQPSENGPASMRLLQFSPCCYRLFLMWLLTLMSLFHVDLYLIKVFFITYS